MKKLPEHEIESHQQLVDRLQTAYDHLESELGDFNTYVKDQFKAMIGPRVDELNGAVDDLKNWFDTQHDEAQSYFDDQSEKWQEGTRGEQYQKWIDSFEESANVIDNVEIEAPEEIEMPEVDILAVSSIETEPDTE